MKQSIALTVLLTIFSTTAFAEDLPKSGKYSGRYMTKPTKARLIPSARTESF